MIQNRLCSANYGAIFVNLSLCCKLFRYLATMQLMGNGFLQSQGYSKAVMFDPARPAESLSSLANAVFKRQFGLKINSEVYIKPAVTYVQVRETEHQHLA